MKLKVSELEGDKLDYWAGKAADEPVGFDSEGRVMSGRNGDDYSPSTDWSHGGPIIEKESISIGNHRQSDHEPMPEWVARMPGNNPRLSFGPTPLIAAMRAFVRSKFGDEVVTP